MPRYRMTFETRLTVTVEIEEDDLGSPLGDEDQAADAGWEIAQAFAQRVGTQTGDPRITSAEADFDGIGTEDIAEIKQKGWTSDHNL